VVIYPKVMGGDSGKNILGTIAMIALSVVSAGIVGSGWAAMGIKAGTFAAYAASAAVMFIGGHTGITEEGKRLCGGVSAGS
jgi:hypothetical protein